MGFVLITVSGNLNALFGNKVMGNIKIIKEIERGEKWKKQ